MDETGTLTQSELNSLLKKLEDFDKQTSTQVVVYMISSLNGESIEDVSYKIAEKNKIGKKGKDNGVLVLIAKNDRKMRIEVGYGLEGVLTDAYTTQIRTKEMNPSFQAGKFYEGINKGVDAIIAVSKGEYKADKKKNNDGSGLMCLGFPYIYYNYIWFYFLQYIYVNYQTYIRLGRQTLYWRGADGAAADSLAAAVPGAAVAAVDLAAFQVAAVHSAAAVQSGKLVIRSIINFKC